MSFVVREYRPEDLADVLGAWESASAIAHPFLTDEFMARERRAIPELYLPNAETWVIEEGDRVVGFLALIGNEVGAIFIRPECQGRGAGRALMDMARGLRGTLEVEVFKENAIGRRFYDCYGFRPLHEYLHGPSGRMMVRMRLAAVR